MLAVSQPESLYSGILGFDKNSENYYNSDSDKPTVYTEDQEFLNDNKKDFLTDNKEKTLLKDFNKIPDWYPEY